ncbi:myb-like protein X [Battus philenor]|uniref:myb-like protein X n=1 Tax=Battus philenor TaxID=42288 RepID=UPI0035CE90EA
MNPQESMESQENEDKSNSLEDERNLQVSLSTTPVYNEANNEKGDDENINQDQQKEYSSEEKEINSRSNEVSLENSNESKSEEDEDQIHNSHQIESSSNKKPFKLSAYDEKNINDSGNDENIYFPNKTHENYTQNKTLSSLETLSEEGESIESESKESKENVNSRSTEEIRENQNDKQIHINDEEVKPVVELNLDSSESSEENIGKMNYSDLKKQSKLKSFSEEDVDKMNKEKIFEQNENLEKIDVKQQFERIPLDYNHASKHITTKNDVNNEKDPKKESKNSEDRKDIEGTLDTFVPTNPKYDDELDIKFHDLTIKLPEIKLPEDILSFAYDSPDYKSKKDEDAQKQKFFYHSNDDYTSDEKDEEVKPKDDFDKYYNNDNVYAYKTQKSNIQSEEEDNEDLYDKFVRERFGKNYNKKKSEKIRIEKHNAGKSPLHNTLRNILKKTENIKKEAENSGDPNPNYMWTLEYGERL